MEIRNKKKRIGGASVCALLVGLIAPVVAVAQTTLTPPVATPPYTVSVFAQSPQGVSQPDSIVLWNDSVFVGFQDRVAKDGTDGKSSTIVEFSLSGKVKRMFQVPGHNDGLRLIGDDDLWALQNEDANPNLVVIDLRSGLQTLYQFPPTPHGGGYDDIVVKHGRVYLTASNPNLDPNGVNVFPALVRATLSGKSVILQPVLHGDASATDLATGKTVTLNLTDPDSMTVDPRGNIVFVSQADSVLVFVRHPGATDQVVGVLALSSSVTGPNGALITIDDTAFAPATHASLLVTDVGAGVIYRINRTVLGASGFESGRAYSASDTLGLVGTLNVDNGFITPIVTGFGSARGLLFLSADADGAREHEEDDRDE
jgi:hypothetical protein